MRTKIAPAYTSQWLETDRPQPLSDNYLESLIVDILAGKINKDISDNVYNDFKIECEEWLLNSAVNKLTGLDKFERKDICIGCTQFIDAIYMNGLVQVLRTDYKYHERLQQCIFKDVGSLIPNIPLIIAMPFPSTGAVHTDMAEILNECLLKNIPVHIDGAWITCCKDIVFDFFHPAIHSVGISLSKGLGLGWNRIGLRWSRQFKQDSITIMNDFHMNNRVLVMIGLHFLRNVPSDYLWKTYSSHYYKICADFNLTPTHSIYLALNAGQPVGISPLIRYLENDNKY
jgi:hypothetical protein